MVPSDAAAGVLVLPRDMAVSQPARTAADAFIEDLFARHHTEIYAYLVRMVRDPDLAADLAQDAFVKAYRAHATLEKPENARAWLYQIAHRVALDRRVAQRRSVGGAAGDGSSSLR
jgi:RNA polymerase sigma-70 factor (ECF subfamily)